MLPYWDDLRSLGVDTQPASWWAGEGRREPWGEVLLDQDAEAGGVGAGIGPEVAVMLGEAHLPLGRRVDRVHRVPLEVQGDALRA